MNIRDGGIQIWFIAILIIFLTFIGWAYVTYLDHSIAPKQKYCDELNTIMDTERFNDKQINQNVLSNYTKNCSN